MKSPESLELLLTDCSLLSIASSIDHLSEGPSLKVLVKGLKAKFLKIYTFGVELLHPLFI